MPSPFPGMDPYLEGTEWTSVHAELGSEIARQLAPKLSPKYIVRPTRRFVTESLDDFISVSAHSMYPDVGVLSETPWSEAAAATEVVVAAPIRLATVVPAQVPVVSVEIRDVANRVLVTAIEILLPTNKRGEGYRDYVEKRSRLLRSSTHLMEIDLLRTGQRVPMAAPLPHAPYFVFLSRAGQRPVLDVWPITLAMRLPVVPVPLLPGDPDTTLDLQAALDSLYDALRFDLTIDYTQPPEIPLDEEDTRWAEDYLRGREPRM